MLERDRVVDILREAQAAVDEAKVSPDLRASALTAAIELLRSDQKRTVTEKASALAPVQTEVRQGTLEQLSAGVGVDIDEVAQVFTITDDGLEVIVPPSRLPDTKRAAMRELVLLFCVGRQLGGWDVATSGTTLDASRAVCERYGQRFFDANNFMNAVNDLGDSLRKLGERGAMRLILTPTGRTAGRVLIQERAHD